MNNSLFNRVLGMYLLCMPFMQSYAAPTVTIQDSLSTSECGMLQGFSLDENALSVMTDGTCIGTGGSGQPVAVNKGPIDVNENASVAIDLSVGATVTLPISSATKVSGPTLPNAGVTISGTTATYNAPPSGTVTGTTIDSFRFTLTDATAQTSNEATVSLTVHESTVVPPSGCVPSTSLICKGALNYPQGNHYQVPINTSTVHAWTFAYNSETVSIAVENDGPNAIYVSSTAGDTTVSWPCTSGSQIKIGTTSGIYNDQCVLTPGQSYYLNVKKPDNTSGIYDLAVYNNTP
jgi:hypothetical protein